MNCRSGARGQGGFTLFEVIISVSLMAVVLGTAYACLNAGFSTQRLITPRADALQKARVALDLITRDLRCACLLPGGTDFIGFERRIGDAPADNLDFATHNYSPARPGEGDYCEVSFFLDGDPATGQLSLWRRVNPMIGMDPLSGGRRQELVTGVCGLRFEYYDGYEWFSAWGDATRRAKRELSSRSASNLSGLPAAVRISLMLETEKRRGDANRSEREPPLVFQSVTRLALAVDANRRITSGLASSIKSSQPPQPGAPSAGPPTAP
jgi:prepilin-type N-terminal cleavage/methylation domain-containing protein